MTAPASPNMNDLMARIGYLFLYWGFLEEALRERHEQVKAHADNSPALTEARLLRNLLAHKIVGASADPSTGEEPFVTCGLLKDDRRRVTFSQLESAIAAIEHARGALQRERPPS